MSSHPSSPEVLFDAETIRVEVQRLGRELRQNLSAEPLLVSLLNESVLFVADLVRAMPCPLRYEFIHVECSPTDAVDEIMKIQYPIPFELARTDLLLIRDLTTSGVIESYLVEQLREHGARRVRIASLVDMPDRRTTNIATDFHAFTVTGEVGTLVGYGMKQEGRFGNLPHIAHLPATAR